jgi:hypothetical protein
MGSYHGKCPKCGENISFRDEHTDWADFLDEEYQRGYDEGIGDKEGMSQTLKENEQLRSLLAANVRVIKQEIKKELGL